MGKQRRSRTRENMGRGDLLWDRPARTRDQSFQKRHVAAQRKFHQERQSGKDAGKNQPGPRRGGKNQADRRMAGNQGLRQRKNIIGGGIRLYQDTRRKNREKTRSTEAPPGTRRRGGMATRERSSVDIHQGSHDQSPLGCSAKEPPGREGPESEKGTGAERNEEKPRLGPQIRIPREQTENAKRRRGGTNQ